MADTVKESVDAEPRPAALAFAWVEKSLAFDGPRELVRRGDETFVRDLGSSKGTLVNGERVRWPAR